MVATVTDSAYLDTVVSKRTLRMAHAVSDDLRRILHQYGLNDLANDGVWASVDRLLSGEVARRCSSVILLAREEAFRLVGEADLAELSRRREGPFGSPRG